MELWPHRGRKDKLVRGLYLFLLAVLLAALFMPVGIIYTMLRFWVKADFSKWFSRLGKYFFTVALSIDQLGNVVLQELFDDLLIKSYGYSFGNEDETISSVLGKNRLRGSLTCAGKALDKLLNLFEHNHTIKHIETDETETF